jgi:voltage-gated potassium channel
MEKLSKQKYFGSWQLIVLILSIYILMALFIETVFSVSDDTRKIIGYSDTFVCVIFLIDFAYNFFSAKNKIKYLRWGWIDLISSIPTVHAFRVGRMMRIVRILRLLRGVKAQG